MGFAKLPGGAAVAGAPVKILELSGIGVKIGGHGTNLHSSLGFILHYLQACFHELLY